MFIFAISSSAVGRRTPFRKVTSRVSFSIPAARWSFGLGRRHRHASPIGTHGFSSHCRFRFARRSTLTWAKRWRRNRPLKPRKMLFVQRQSHSLNFFYAIIERSFDNVNRKIIFNSLKMNIIFVELISEMLIIAALYNFKRERSQNQFSEWRHKNRYDKWTPFYQRRKGTWLFIRVLIPRSPRNATSGHLSPPIADVCKFTESLIAANFFWTFPDRKTIAIARGMHSRPFMPPCTDREHEQRTRVRSNGHINDNQLSVWCKSVSR